MFAVTGITGQVGGVVAQTLLEAGHEVRAIVRNPAKADTWAERGCDIRQADLADQAALAAALRGTEGVFLVLPPMFDPAPGFPEASRLIEAIRAAVLDASPGKLVCLSTIGAQVKRPSLLNQLGLMEQQLGALPLPVTFLRAAWFMENAAQDVQSARQGLVSSFLQPLDQGFPMVAVADIGRLAAELLQASWSGQRFVEFTGPADVSPTDIATAFSNVLGHPVRVEAIPRADWETRFRSQGMRNPTPRAQMLDGFNQGWIAFEATPQRGGTTIDMVLAELARSQ